MLFVLGNGAPRVPRLLLLTFSGLPTASYGWGGGWGGWERSLGPHCCHTPAASFAFSTSASTMAGFESMRSLLCALLAMVIVLLEETISAIRMLTHPHLPHPMLNIAEIPKLRNIIKHNTTYQ